MTEYIRLLEIVKNKMEVREDSFGSVIAAKIHNNEEFDLMMVYWTAAHSSCCKREKINGTFVGEDWYFIESDTTDYGMDGKSTTYFTQTLTEKKQKFLEFCRKFDADEQPTSVPAWIPCSERLPEEKDAGILKKLGTNKRSDYVIATVEVKDERMTVTACTYDGAWNWNMKYAFPDFKVIAWMPLPEPYKMDEVTE